MRATLAILTAVLVPLAACSASFGADDTTPGITGQGTGGTRTYAAQGFSRIDLAGSDEIDVRVGPGFSVRADGDSDLLDHVKITLSGDTLRVSRFRTSGWHWGGGHARISVTLPALAGVSIAGSGDVTVDQVRGEHFTGKGAGSGHLTVGTMQVNLAELNYAGSGGAKLGGTAQRLNINIAGSGGIDAGALHATQANVSIAGSGNVRATVTGNAKVSVMGSGDVDLGGGAHCEVHKMGSGSVRCGG